MENRNLNEEKTEKNTKKNTKKTVLIIVISILSVCIVAGSIGAAVWFSNGNKDSNSSIEAVSGTYTASNEESGTVENASQTQDGELVSTSAEVSQSTGINESYIINASSNVELPPVTSSNTSRQPVVTVATQVANGICVIGGICSNETEYITVTGDNVKETRIVPFAGESQKYFLGQVKFNSSVALKVAAKETGKELSTNAFRYVTYRYMNTNYMTRGEYCPVICENSQMHFYSALLSYTLPASRVSSDMRTIAETNISDIVAEARSYGAEPIFLIIPSSAEIYPETLPSGYTRRSGDGIYEVFEDIATKCGAKVIYPLETMKSHSNDGDGYQIYQHTDSHWSTYGSYWGTYDLMQYISGKFPNAKPRTVSEMGFYTIEMNGGDALFNFPKNVGFENSVDGGLTTITRIKELTNLYSLKMPTSTLRSVYNDNTGINLTNSNKEAKKVTNSNGSGLPKAIIMRDSFGKVSYDMLNDRFSTVYWGEFDNYSLPYQIIDTNKVDYMIYLYSERNLLKIMLKNSGANLLTIE